MNSFIIIEGLGLWIFLMMFLLLFFAFIFFGIAYIKEARKNDRLTSRNQYLRRRLKFTEQEYYKATFKLPEVDE